VNLNKQTHRKRPSVSPLQSLPTVFRATKTHQSAPPTKCSSRRKIRVATMKRRQRISQPSPVTAPREPKTWPNFKRTIGRMPLRGTKMSSPLSSSPRRTVEDWVMEP
jgi:hypothetical protein